MLIYLSIYCMFVYLYVFVLSRSLHRWQADLADLQEKIDWCRANDDACRTIARNALAIYNSFVSRDGVLDYMQCVFVEISKVG